MKEFTQTELEQIQKELKQYCKENKEITDTTDVIEQLRDSTDFFNEQYRIIENTINDYLRYNGIVRSANIKEIIEELEDLEQKEYGVFTKANVIVSIITAVILFIGAVSADNVVFLALLAYGLLWAYLSRYIGLKKGIDSGYVWGYCLGLIGFIVICVLQGEKQEETTVSNSNKYEDLEKLQKLKDNGTITQEEFEKEKAKILE